MPPQKEIHGGPADHAPKPHGQRELLHLADGRQSAATPSTNPLDDWTATIQDDVGSIGIGGTYALTGRADLKLFSRYQKVDGNNDLDSPPGGAPDIAVGIDSFDDTKLWTSSAEVEGIVGLGSVSLR